MKVVLSGNLMRFASFEKELEIEATTVGQALDVLVGRYPDLKPVLLDGAGGIRKVHRLFLNGDVLDHGGRDQVLEPRDELGVLTAIAGG